MTRNEANIKLKGCAMSDKQVDRLARQILLDVKAGMRYYDAIDHTIELYALKPSDALVIDEAYQNLFR